MITTVYLVRHGQTDMNAEGRCQGSLDVPLNGEGEAQVQRLSERLREIRFDAAYTSPLQRAARTAEMILAGSDVSAARVTGFSELSYGAWQGTTYEEWPAGATARWHGDPHAMEFPEGETLSRVRDRAVPALEQIVRENAGRTVLVTAHGHLNRVLLSAMLAQQSPAFWDIPQPNCATWKLLFEVQQAEVTLISAAAMTDQITLETARRAIDSKTKPLGALGYLEQVAVRLSLIQQTFTPEIRKARVCVFAADHGVADEGVSAYPRAVTAEMMKNFNAGGAAINVLGRANDVEIEVVDVGVDADLLSLAGVKHEKVRGGSRNFLHESAMTHDELDQALQAGARAVHRAIGSEVRAIGLGEMGIANTTSAAALLSAFTGRSAKETVGVGTGVSEQTLVHKCDVVERAIGVHAIDASTSAREVLRQLGGLEIAAMTGAVLEATRHSLVVVADGFISSVAVLAAALIAKESSHITVAAVADRVFFAHRSTERGYNLAIDTFASVTGESQRPLLDLSMRLGEGSGAALAMPILRAAAAIMSDMATFESAGVSAGENADQHR